MERRVDSRLDVKLPCHIYYPGNTHLPLAGVTENMSRGGVLVLWSGENGAMLPNPGEILTAEIELPAQHSFGRRYLHCHVTVARVSAGEKGAALVAFRIHQMQFRNCTGRRWGQADLIGLGQLVM